MDVIRARSDQALRRAQQQLRGALGKRIRAFVERLLQCCASIEAFIDFPEEDLPPDDRSARIREITALTAEIRALQATRLADERLREGLRVAIVGEPNAGKSTLLNRMAGYERAIVSEKPGTTRDFLEEAVLLGGHHIRFVDTAGLRETDDEIERAGVERALECAATSDLIVLVVDGSEPLGPLPDCAFHVLSPERTILVVNKVDRMVRNAAIPADWNFPIVKISALKGTGMPDLEGRITDFASKLVSMSENEELIAVNSRHAACLAEACVNLEAAGLNLERNASLEIVACEVRSAVDALAGIVEDVDNELVLDKIFQSFCIGK
jgi:tRNA modification GTPase